MKIKFDLDLKGRLRIAQNQFKQIFGLRFLTWKKIDGKEKWKIIREDLVQNLMLLANGILALIFAIEWNSDNNPLLIINNKFKSGINISMDIFNTDQVTEFADSLNFFTCLVNVINAIISFSIVILWTFTTFGARSSWMKARLASCSSLLASIFIVLAAMIFSTFFDQLVILGK